MARSRNLHGPYELHPDVTILSARLVRTRRHGFSIYEATLEDESGRVGLVFYNQPSGPGV